MFKVILLVCAATVAPVDCQPETAIHQVIGPDASNEVMCGFQSQAYLAQTWIGQSLAKGDYVKIICRRGPRGRLLDEASARP